MRILLTGGAGFLGWHLSRHLLEAGTSSRVRCLDLLTYAASDQAVLELQRDFPRRYEFVRGDIRDPEVAREAMKGVDAVIHAAAESHVDRSIADAAPFVSTNVLGTQVLIGAALRAGVRRFLHISTDEVYGHIPRDAPATTRFTESSPLRPRSPYAASKAAAEMMVRAAVVTHGLPAVVVRPCNAYGPGQYPEKLIPVAIRCAAEGRPVPLYGDGQQVREWVHAADHARGLAAALEKGRPGALYNLGGGDALTNVVLVRRILAAAGAPEDAVTFVRDRPGHDQRYAMDSALAAAELGWRPERPLADGLAETVSWYGSAGEGWW